jgi:hypothetical protein
MELGDMGILLAILYLRYYANNYPDELVEDDTEQ